MAGPHALRRIDRSYLETIYRLEREMPCVTTSGLADLGAAAASVSGMLKNLASDGYVERGARGGARLTPHGLDERQHAISLELARLVTVLPVARRVRRR